METAPPVTGTKRSTVAFIFVTVALDMLAMGMIAPVLPGLVSQFLGGNTSQAAEMYGLFATVWGIIQFVCAPILGSLSDRYGRRPVILLSNFGMGLDYLVMAVAPTLPWLFVGRVFSGATSASIPTAMAYITDLTPPEKRSAAFGMISAAFGLGFVLGPAFGGILGQYNPRLPFWVAGGLSLLNACYGLFVLPESLPLTRRSPFSWKRANPVGALTLLSSNKQLLRLATNLFLGYLAQQALPSVWVLYSQYRYQWDNRLVGISLAVVGFSSAVVGAGLVRPITKAIGDRASLNIGLIFGALGFTLYGIAQTPALFWIGIPVMALWGLAGPVVQGTMTSYVSPSQQGQLQGAITSMRSITGLIGPALFTLSFAAAIKPGLPFQLPGTPFFISALLLLVSLPLARAITHRTR